EAGAPPGTPQARTRVVHVAGVEEATAGIAALLAPGDVVLVKGPRVTGLERVAQALTGGERQ
ncbi:UDP-N-acetylmuramoyl-tripeptide--D-alanyl-D-alanine ligase, partial [Streptosporangium algeriense]